MAFFMLEPFGYEVENFRSGLITSMVANTARDTKKRPKPFLPEDFMPQEPEDEVQMELTEAEAAARRAKIDAAMQAFAKPAPKGAQRASMRAK